MRRFAVALTLLAVATGARRAAAQAAYHVTWWDAVSVVAAGALGAGPEAAGLPHGPPPCAPCDPLSLPAIDRVALHTFSGAAGSVSSVVLAGLVGFSGI